MTAVTYSIEKVNNHFLYKQTKISRIQWNLSTGLFQSIRIHPIVNRLGKSHRTTINLIQCTYYQINTSRWQITFFALHTLRPTLCPLYGSFLHLTLSDVRFVLYTALFAHQAYILCSIRQILYLTLSGVHSVLKMSFCTSHSKNHLISVLEACCLSH